MSDGKRHSAEWRDRMTATEREQMDLATDVHDAAATQLRRLTEVLKARCIQRMRRGSSKE